MLCDEKCELLYRLRHTRVENIFKDVDYFELPHGLTGVVLSRHVFLNGSQMLASPIGEAVEDRDE